MDQNEILKWQGKLCAPIEKMTEKRRLIWSQYNSKCKGSGRMPTHAIFIRNIRIISNSSRCTFNFLFNLFYFSDYKLLIFWLIVSKQREKKYKRKMREKKKIIILNIFMLLYNNEKKLTWSKFESKFGFSKQFVSVEWIDVSVTWNVKSVCVTIILAFEHSQKLSLKLSFFIVTNCFSP